jgi:hypothetical protein
MQLTSNTHHQAISEEIKSIFQSDAIPLSFSRTFTTNEIVSQYTRLFPLKSNQYLESSGFDLDESQFSMFCKHLFLHDEDSCAILMFSPLQRLPANILYFSDRSQKLLTANLLAWNFMIDNEEFPVLLTAFPHLLLTYLHHQQDSGRRYNFLIVPEVFQPSLTSYLVELLDGKSSLHLLHSSHLPLLIHNFQVQVALINQCQVLADQKHPFFLEFNPHPTAQRGELTIAKQAGVWHRRDTSLFSNMNIQASYEFSEKPTDYIRQPVDRYRLFDYEKLKTPFMEGIIIHFHYKPQLFKIIIEEITARVTLPFTFSFIHLNTSYND